MQPSGTLPPQQPSGTAPQPPSTSYAQWNISLDWTEEEQRTFEAGLARYPPAMDAPQRYVKLAASLPRKSVRDVALRARWRVNQQLLKKRKGLEQQLAAPAARKHGLPLGAPGVPAPAYPGAALLPPLPPDSAGGAIVEGPIAQLLDANFSILGQFRSNMGAFKVAENTQLLAAFRDNILAVINQMEAMGGVMAQMPPLPVRMNVDLANSFLPARPAGVGLSHAGMGMMPPPQPAVDAPGMVPVFGQD